MKKITRFISLLLIAATLFALSACGTKPETPEDPDDGNTNDPTTELAEIKVGVLKGATGIGAVKLMQDSEDKKTTGKYDIQLYETANVANLNKDILNGTVNIAALPINAGATLYNKSEGKVQIIAANALGVLSILGKDELTSISALKGKTLHTTGQASTPQYILEYLLVKNGLQVSEVNIVYYADGNQALAGMLKDGGYAMLPEPATTAALSKNADLKLLMSVTDEWAKVSDKKLIQGCLVVNTEFAKAHPEEIKTFLSEYASTVKYVQENPSDAADLVVKYGIIAAKPMAEKSLPRCGVVCITGENMKADVKEMLTVLFNANAASVGGKLPDDAYYYVAK